MFDQFVILARSGERGEATACLSVRRMKDAMAKNGVISKEIKRIFQRVSEIIDED